MNKWKVQLKTVKTVYVEAVDFESAVKRAIAENPGYDELDSVEQVG